MPQDYQDIVSKKNKDISGSSGFLSFVNSPKNKLDKPKEQNFLSCDSSLRYGEESKSQTKS